VLFAQQRIRLRIEEVRVRVEHAQHARNRAVVDGFVWADLLRVVLLYHAVNVREAANAVANFGIARGGSVTNSLSKKKSQESAGENYKNNCNE
jgi:hypothetical protein